MGNKNIQRMGHSDLLGKINPQMQKITSEIARGEQLNNQIDSIIKDLNGYSLRNEVEDILDDFLNVQEDKFDEHLNSWRNEADLRLQKERRREARIRREEREKRTSGLSSPFGNMPFAFIGTPPTMPPSPSGTPINKQKIPMSKPDTRTAMPTNRAQSTQQFIAPPIQGQMPVNKKGKLKKNEINSMMTGAIPKQKISKRKLILYTFGFILNIASISLLVLLLLKILQII